MLHAQQGYFGSRYLSSSTKDLRTKGARTELSDYLKQVIVGLMLGDLRTYKYHW